MESLDFDAVAEAWSRWWPTFERGAGAVSEALVRAAGIRPGNRVLDLATGLGEPAIPAARAAMPGGTVVGIDVSPAMLALAEKRAHGERLTNVTFVEADVDGFATEERFDAIVSRWGLMFVAQLDPVLLRMREYLREGGRFAAAVWAAPPEVPLISLPQSVAAEHFGAAVPPLERGPFALHDVAHLQQRFVDCGYRDVSAEDVAVVFPLASASEYFEFVRQTAPPVVSLLRRLDEAQRDAFRRAVERVVTARFGVSDGTIRVPNRAVVVRAERGETEAPSRRST